MQLRSKWNFDTLWISPVPHLVCVFRAYRVLGLTRGFGHVYTVAKVQRPNCLQLRDKFRPKWILLTLALWRLYIDCLGYSATVCWKYLSNVFCCDNALAFAIIYIDCRVIEHNLWKCLYATKIVALHVSDDCFYFFGYRMERVRDEISEIKSWEAFVISVRIISYCSTFDESEKNEIIKLRNYGTSVRLHYLFTPL